MTRISVYDLLDNRRINYVSKPVSAGFITIKGGDMRFCPYEVSFWVSSYPFGVLAHLPRVEGVTKSSEMATFDLQLALEATREPRPRGVISDSRHNWVRDPARAAYYPKASNLGLTALYKRAVSYEGLILWDAGGTPLTLYQETK